MTSLISKLPEEIIESISSYFLKHNKTHNIQTLLKNNRRTLYYSWYSDWVKVSANIDSVWYQICKYKNNLAFINLVFLEFDYILQKENKLNSPPPTVHLENFYDYANDVHIEAFGEELPKKEYERVELLSIIKECEHEIKLRLVNNIPPSHNVVRIHI